MIAKTLRQKEFDREKPGRNVKTVHKRSSVYRVKPRNALLVAIKWNIAEKELLPQTNLHINETNQLSQENYQPPSGFTNHTLSIDDTPLASVCALH